MLRNDDTYKTPAGDADMARINASAKALSELLEAGNELSAMEAKMRRALDAYVDADRAMRAKVAPTAVAGPSDSEIDALVASIGPTEGIRRDSRDLTMGKLRVLVRRALATWGHVKVARCEGIAQAAPADPLDTPLPCDLTAGGVTIGKGCPLRTVQLRLQVQADANALLLRRAKAAPAAVAGHIDLVTRESALQAIEHVAIHNSASREREAVEMLAAAPATKAAPQPAAQQETVLYDELKALEIFEAARAGSDKPSGVLRGIRAVIASWECRESPAHWLIGENRKAVPAAQGDAEDAARYQALVREAHENKIRARAFEADAARYRWLRTTPGWDVLGRLFELRDVALDAAIDAARKQGANHD